MPVIYKEKVEYAYTDPGVKAHTLSWAEYQALPTAQKMNGDLYIIPDKQPEGNPSRIWAKLGTDPLTTQADDVSGAVNELNASLSQNIVTERFNMGEQTIAAGGRGVFTISVLKTGYTPLGIIEIALSNNGYYVGSYTINSNGTAQVVMHSGSSIQTTQIVYITVIYKKN